MDLDLLAKFLEFKFLTLAALVSECDTIQNTISAHREQNLGVEGNGAAYMTDFTHDQRSDIYSQRLHANLELLEARKSSIIGKAWF